MTYLNNLFSLDYFATINAVKNPKQFRLILSLATLGFIAVTAFLVLKTAQGYRLDLKNKAFSSTGILAATSVPEGAQIWIDGKLKTATDDNINLTPGQYQIEIKKDGFHSWQKELIIEEQLVTSAHADLFSKFPDFKALTFTGAISPVLSPDFQRVVFGTATASAQKQGLWVLELSDSPLGFSREPRQIIKNTVGGRDFSKGSFTWSPDSKQVLATLTEEATNGNVIERHFLVETDRLNSEQQLVSLSEIELETLLERWKEEEDLRQTKDFSLLPAKLQEALIGNVDELSFSPDQTKILYLATASAVIPEGIVPPLPASNSQPEERQISAGKYYVYDLKEDKNFAIQAKTENDTFQTVSWFPTSGHIFIVVEDKVEIVEYDGANRLDAYSGQFENSFAFPFPDGKRILILTSFSKDTPPNLYAVSLR